MEGREEKGEGAMEGRGEREIGSEDDRDSGADSVTGEREREIDLCVC